MSMMRKTASHFSASCSSIEPEIFQAFIELSQPLRVIGDGLAGVGECALRLVAIAHHHIGAHQPQPSLYIISVLLQTTSEALDHATDHFTAIGLAHVFCRRHRII